MAELADLPTIGAAIALIVTIPLGYWVIKRARISGWNSLFVISYPLWESPHCRNFLGLVPSALVHPFMIGLAGPASQSLISKAVPEEQRGIAFGLTLTSGACLFTSPLSGRIALGSFQSQNSLSGDCDWLYWAEFIGISEA